MRPAGQRPHLGPEALSWQSTPVGSKRDDHGSLKVELKMELKLGASLTRITRIRSATVGLESYVIIATWLLAARTILQQHAQVGNLLALVGDVFPQQFNQCQKITQRSCEGVWNNEHKIQK